MPAHDLKLLRDAAIAAGDIAERHFQSGFDIWDKGGGQGPVTEADLEIDAMLKAELTTARPDYGWLSEETEDDTDRLDKDAIFIIDPIDGTRAFVDGQKTFSHSLAIARNGIVTEAVIHLPMLDKTYHSRAGNGAWCNDTRLTVAPREDIENATILAAKFNLTPDQWTSGPPPFARHFRPSLAYRMGLVADAAFDGMLTLRDTWEWDVAAGTLLVQEAGGTVTTRTGETPRYNNPHPALNGLLAAGPKLHANLLAELR